MTEHCTSTLEQQVTLKLNKAIKLVSYCLGEDEMYQFINACNLVVLADEKINVPILIWYIITRL